VQTGMAAFGEDRQYGVVNADDMLQLVKLSIEGTLFKGDDTNAAAVRRITRALMPMFNPADLLMLAATIGEGHAEQVWRDLMLELEIKANEPGFKQA
jgi:hypothetical protein